MGKEIISDDTRIGLACDIAHYILTEYIHPQLVYACIEDDHIIEDNPNGDGTQYTKWGQTLFDPIYDTIEEMIMIHFVKENHDKI